MAAVDTLGVFAVMQRMRAVVLEDGIDLNQVMRAACKSHTERTLCHIGNVPFSMALSKTFGRMKLSRPTIDAICASFPAGPADEHTVCVRARHDDALHASAERDVGAADGAAGNAAARGHPAIRPAGDVLDGDAQRAREGHRLHGQGIVQVGAPARVRWPRARVAAERGRSDLPRVALRRARHVRRLRGRQLEEVLPRPDGHGAGGGDRSP
eukprot:scaffold105371_cov72-Phaeocystis_antarctica.AAC.1